MQQVNDILLFTLQSLTTVALNESSFTCRFYCERGFCSESTWVVGIATWKANLVYQRVARPEYWALGSIFWGSLQSGKMQKAYTLAADHWQVHSVRRRRHFQFPFRPPAHWQMWVIILGLQRDKKAALQSVFWDANDRAWIIYVRYKNIHELRYPLSFFPILLVKGGERKRERELWRAAHRERDSCLRGWIWAPLACGCCRCAQKRPGRPITRALFAKNNSPFFISFSILAPYILAPISKICNYILIFSLSMPAYKIKQLTKAGGGDENCCLWTKIILDNIKKLISCILKIHFSS